MVMTREDLLRRLAPLLWKAQTLRWRLLGGQVLGVKMMLVRERRVLLVRQTYRAGWFIPGGGLKRGEDVASAARREVWEEVGAKVGQAEFVGLYSKRWGRVMNHTAVLWSDDFEMEPREHWEVQEVKFFPVDELPPGLAPGDRRVIEEHFAGTVERLGQW